MPKAYVAELLNASAQGDGTAVTGTAAASMLPAQALATIPPGWFDVLGKRAIIRCHGRISNIVTTPGTLTLDVRFGGTIISTSVAFQLNAVAKTSVAWWLDLALVLRVTGASAAVLGQGEWMSESVVGSPLPSVGGSGSLAWQASTPANGTAFDARIAQQVDMFAKFSLTGNSITSHDFELLLPN